MRRALATLLARVLAVALLALAGGCGAGGGGAGGGGAGGAASGAGELTVFAAASLTETFTALGERFGAQRPGVEVSFNFAASSALAQQIDRGAPADVFASASLTNLRQVGLAGEPVVFAANVLQIAVPDGNPGGVTGLADLARPQLRIALCAEQVPCGAAARAALRAAGVTAAPDTLEQDAKATLTKVVLGEVDAALVYRTDVIAAGTAVQGIEFPQARDSVVEYGIAVVAGARDAEAATAFVDLVRSPAGRAVLADAGFELP